MDAGNTATDSEKGIDLNDPGLPGGKFARLLVEEGVIDTPLLEKAVRIQNKLGRNKLLSSILIELGIISEDDHRRLIRNHGRKFWLGEIVCELGYITLEQWRKAEEAMNTASGKRMGEILQDLNFINDRQLAQALSEQLGIPLMHIDIDMVDKELVGQFPIHFMQKNLIIPFDASKTKVSVIMADPLNETAVREIGHRLKKEPEVSIGPESAVRSIISKLESRSGKEGAEAKDHVADVVDSILLAAIRDRASDIHLEPMANHMRIRLRMDGVLIHKMDLPHDLSQRVLARVKVLAGMDISDNRRHQDGRITRSINHLEVDFRVSTYATVFGENLVMRILRRDGGLKSLEQTQMSPMVMDRFKHEALDMPTGVIIITGPTGSGKTTTLYAAIDYLNRPTSKIITVEDPVEYVIDGIMQCSVHKKAGRTFEDSLKAIVRQDPDIIVLGEIRDRNSAGVAVQAALTGHKVLTTFHTEDSIGGLLRLIDMGIETFLISSTVVSILAQRLIRTICPDCRQAYMPDRRIAAVVGLDQETLKHHTFYRGTGCSSCHGTGYRGRTSLHELLVLNEDVRDAILEQKTSHEVRRISCQSTDLLSLMENGLYKVLQGQTTVEEVYRIAPRSLSDRSVEEIIKIMEG